MKRQFVNCNSYQAMKIKKAKNILSPERQHKGERIYRKEVHTPRPTTVAMLTEMANQR